MDWIMLGGPVMAPLLVASLVAVAVIVERFRFYHAIQTQRKTFLDELYDALDVHETKAAEELCRRHPGPLASLAMAAIAASDREREDLKEVMAEAGERELPALEARLGLLATIAHVSPMLGLLGTVLGIVISFQQFQQVAKAGGQPGPELMAGGIWQALITTVAGLTIGIVSQIAHNWLFTLKERLVRDMEDASFELLEIVADKRRR